MIFSGAEYLTQPRLFRFMCLLFFGYGILGVCEWPLPRVRTCAAKTSWFSTNRFLVAAQTTSHALFFAPRSLMLFESRGGRGRMEGFRGVQQQGPRHGQALDANLFYWVAVRRFESTLESRRAKSRPLFLGMGGIRRSVIHHGNQPYFIHVSVCICVCVCTFCIHVCACWMCLLHTRRSHVCMCV
jgi:hypothetical protein